MTTPAQVPNSDPPLYSPLREQMQHRRDTIANWAAANPVLLDGEIGFVTDDLYQRIKHGDGVTAWNDLPWTAEQELKVGNITQQGAALPNDPTDPSKPFVTVRPDPAREPDQLIDINFPTPQPGQPGEPGRDGASISLVGSWVPCEVYNKGDVVYYNGESFGNISNEMDPCTPPDQSEDWQQMVQKGAKGDPGDPATATQLTLTYDTNPAGEPGDAELTTTAGGYHLQINFPQDTTGGGSGGGATTLDQLTDVTTSTPADGQVLTWNAATNQWIPVTPTTGGSGGGPMALNDLTDVNAPAPADNQAITWDAATSQWIPTDVVEDVQVQTIAGPNNLSQSGNTSIVQIQEQKYLNETYYIGQTAANPGGGSNSVIGAFPNPSNLRPMRITATFSWSANVQNGPARVTYSWDIYVNGANPIRPASMDDDIMADPNGVVANDYGHSSNSVTFTIQPGDVWQWNGGWVAHNHPQAPPNSATLVSVENQQLTIIGVPA